MSAQGRIDDSIETDVPGACPICGEAFADPDDVNTKLGPHEPTLDENQIYRRHRRHHLWDELTLRKPKNDKYLHAHYASSTNNSEDSEYTQVDLVEEYLVTFHYRAELVVPVEATSKREAKRTADAKQAREGLEPHITDRVHTDVSQW